MLTSYVQNILNPVSEITECYIKSVDRVNKTSMII